MAGFFCSENGTELETVVEDRGDDRDDVVIEDRRNDRNDAHKFFSSSISLRTFDSLMVPKS